MLEAKKIVVEYTGTVSGDEKPETKSIVIAYRVQDGIAKLEGPQAMIHDLVWLMNNVKVDKLKVEIVDGV